MCRSVIARMTAIVLSGTCASLAQAQHICKPALAITKVHYSTMKLPELERTWTLAVTVDAAPCATDSGTFSILFTVWKENAPDIEFAETFSWKAGLNLISKKLWVDEAVGDYRVNEVDPCPCRK